MTRTISGKNLQVYFLQLDDKDLTPRLTVDGKIIDTQTDLKFTLEPAHVSEAGSIVNLVAGQTGSTSFIKSVKGAVRSNHYHLTDWHFLYVASGLMYYYWRPRYPENVPYTSLSPLERVRCKPGDMIWTPPMVAHATYFPEETTLIAVNGRARDHESHEGDVRRVKPLISAQSLCPAVMGGVHCVLPFENTSKSVGAHFHNGPHEDALGREFQF